MYRPVTPVYTRVFDRSISTIPYVSRNSEGQMESVQPIKYMRFILIFNKYSYYVCCDSRIVRCDQYLSPLMLWVWISIRVRCKALCNKVCQWLATGRWVFSGYSRFPPPIKKTDNYDITEILLKVALNTIKQTNNSIFRSWLTKKTSPYSI